MGSNPLVSSHQQTDMGQMKLFLKGKSRVKVNFDMLQKLMIYDSSNGQIGNRTTDKTKIWEFFFEALKENSSVNWLELESNSLEEIGAVSSLTRCLVENTSITWLDLSSNSISQDGIKLIASALLRNKSISVLILNKNRIDSNSGFLLAESLKYNTSITKLYLNSNKLGNDGIFYLSNSLKNNTKITHLSLNNNRITYEGISSICQVFSNSSIVWLELADNKIGLEELKLLSSAANETMKDTKITMRTAKIDSEALNDYFLDTQYMHIYYFNSQGIEIGYKKRFTTSSVLVRKIDREIVV